MPKKLQKSLQDYLSKIKKPTTQLHHLPSKTSWILRGCKHPKTPSLALNVKENAAHETNDAATLSDIDRFLFENFSSLYREESDDDDGDDDDDKGKKCDKHNNNRNENNGVVLFESPRFLDLAENFRDSNRFFIQRSSSGSIIEEARTSMSTTSEDMAYSSSTSTTASGNDSTRINNTTDDDDDDEKDEMDADDFIALLTYSADPYDDFKRSMHEMIEARLHFHGKVDWEFMEELLFCCLNLNDKKSYRFILNAFVDLVLVLRENSGEDPAKSWRNARSGGDERRKKREI